ncbi:hypothetical protein BDV38DRAFT_158628 [Aspergillus pseudotamarii]|uniref:Uncharacterized protein n=1 Tax=Aspergillus pseudotamarii TaxID=132259 RepID=A0A5N6SL28_ASPPS|nr:uncharacterized protein BDV38DRAFT_158628 [Aspergillus pseudotamarii]KAE8134619.1 hypothetical protein BDV38DRAFT_158628 [Aspergillus pseudotamarii]
MVEFNISLCCVTLTIDQVSLALGITGTSMFRASCSEIRYINQQGSLELLVVLSDHVQNAPLRSCTRCNRQRYFQDEPVSMKLRLNSE